MSVEPALMALSAQVMAPLASFRRFLVLCWALQDFLPILGDLDLLVSNNGLICTKYQLLLIQELNNIIVYP